MFTLFGLIPFGLRFTSAVQHIRIMERIIARLLCGILLAANIACTQDQITLPDEPTNCYEVPATDYDNESLLTRSWKLLWIENKTTTNRTYPPCPRLQDKDKYLILRFYPDSNICSGIATLNQFGGEYTLSDINGLSVDKIIQTLVGGTEGIAASNFL